MLLNRLPPTGRKAQTVRVENGVGRKELVGPAVEGAGEFNPTGR